MIGQGDRWRLQQLPADWAQGPDIDTRTRAGCTPILIALVLIAVATVVVVSI